MPSDAELMNIAISDLNNVFTSLEDRHCALQELLELVDPIDNANGAWDAVVTCFFIDTAHNIEYIEIISKLLKDGGNRYFAAFWTMRKKSAVQQQVP